MIILQNVLICTHGEACNLSHCAHAKIHKANSSCNQECYSAAPNATQLKRAAKFIQRLIGNYEYQFGRCVPPSVVMKRVPCDT